MKSALVAIPVLMLGSLAFAAETQPSSPRETLLSLLATAKTGDLEATLKFFLTGTEKEKSAAEGLMLEVMPWAVIENATVEKFGKEGIVDRDDGGQLVKDIARVKAGVEKIDGDKAAFYLGDSDGKAPDPLPEKTDIQLKKVDGEWKLDATPTVSMAAKPDSLKRARAIYKAAQAIAAEVRAGRYSNVDEVRRAYKQRTDDIEAATKEKEQK